MERELVGLLGAGLTSAASGFGMTVPVGAIDAGYTLIDVLSRECGPQISSSLNTMVQNLWLSWQQTGLDRATTQHHARALPALIELHRPSPTAFTNALSGQDSANALAADIIQRAHASGDTARANLDEAVAFLLLERMFSVVAAEGQSLPHMMAAIDLYLRTDLWRIIPVPGNPATAEPQHAPAPPRSVAPPFTPTTVSPAAVNTMFSRLSSSAISAVRDGIAAKRPRVEDPAALEAELLQTLATLIERLVSLAQRTPEITTPVLDAAHHLADGAFVAADVTLAAAQEILIHLAQADLGAARKRMQLAAQVLMGRATIEEVRLEYRRASRHYAAAVRGFTKADMALQWHFLMQQANALLRQDQLFDDELALTDAIRTYDQAGQLDTSLVGPLPWAQGQRRLAEVLMIQGRRDQISDCFLKAAHHAGIASNAYASEAVETDAIDMRLLQAECFWLGGDPSADLATLETAAHAYRTALAAFTREQHPSSWANATALFGQVLLRLATLRNDPKLLVEAIERLRSAIQFADLSNIDIDRTTTETTLGRALLAEYAGGGQVLLLDLAATAFRRAIKSAGTEQDLIATAELQHELGMTLWAMAERSGDKQSMGQAADLLEASAKLFTAQREGSRAASVRNDLLRLRDVPASDVVIHHGRSAATTL